MSKIMRKDFDELIDKIDEVGPTGPYCMDREKVELVVRNFMVDRLGVELIDEKQLDSCYCRLEKNIGSEEYMQEGYNGYEHKRTRDKTELQHICPMWIDRWMQGQIEGRMGCLNGFRPRYNEDKNGEIIIKRPKSCIKKYGIGSKIVKE